MPDAVRRGLLPPVQNRNRARRPRRPPAAERPAPRKARGNARPSRRRRTAARGGRGSRAAPRCGLRAARKAGAADRTSVGQGTGVSVRVDLGGGRVIQKKKKHSERQTRTTVQK